MTDQAGPANKWIDEIAKAEADKRYAAWLKSCRVINRRYREDRISEQARNRAAVRRRYAILWSNVQTLSPAIYGKCPTALVSRRYKDADPVARVTSDILERALNYTNEEGGLDSLMKLVTKDYLLPGRGVAWVRYEPVMSPLRIPLQVTNDIYASPTGDTYDKEDVQEDDEGPHVMGEQVTYEKVCEDHVSYDDFVWPVYKEWLSLPWVSRKVAMSREQLVKRKFKDVDKIPLDWKPDYGDNDVQDPGLDKSPKACIYELWHKPTRMVYWISKGCQWLLDERQDPLGLENFFPCPEPVSSSLGLDSYVPIPDYIYYQDQAEELDELTMRIGKLTDALRMVGFYSGENKVELANVFKPGNENILIPIEGWAQFKEGGGSRGVIDWVPIDMVVETLKSCVELRRTILDDIFQITGISDIMRGETDPDETAKAQSLKANFGSLRVRDRQKNIADFARDVIRLKGEIIAGKFSVDTLKAMTGVQLFDSVQQKQMVQQQIQMQAQAMQAQQMPPQPGQPPAPAPKPPPVPQNIQNMLDQPTWEEVDQLLKNQPMRQFRIEIETDSTIEPNEMEQKQSSVEFVTAIGTYLNNSLPVVQAAPQMITVVMEGLKWLTRRFRVGREMEEVIDKAADQIMQAAQNPQPAAPTDPADMAKAQAAQQANQIKAQQVQLDAQKVQQDAQLSQQQFMAEQQRSQADVQIAQTKAETDQAKLALEAHKAAMDIDLRQQELDKPDPKPTVVKK